MNKKQQRAIIDHSEARFPLREFVRVMRSEIKARIRQRRWSTLVNEKIRRKQIGTVPSFFCAREQVRLLENGLKEGHSKLCDGIIVLLHAAIHFATMS